MKKKPEEIIAKRLVEITESFRTIRENAESLTFSELKQAINEANITCRYWKNQQERMEKTLALLIGAILGGLIGVDGFAEALKFLNFLKMLQLILFVTVACVFLPITFVFYERYRRKWLYHYSTREMLIEYLLDEDKSGRN